MIYVWFRYCKRFLEQNKIVSGRNFFSPKSLCRGESFSSSEIKLFIRFLQILFLQVFWYVYTAGWNNIFQLPARFFDPGNLDLWQEILSCHRKFIPVKSNFLLWQEILSGEKKFFILQEISPVIRSYLIKMCFLAKIILLLSWDVCNMASLWYKDHGKKCMNYLLYL